MYGSVQNSMLSTMQNTPVPEAGLPATELWFTDRRPYTITRVSKSGKTFWMTPIDTMGGHEIRVYLSRSTGKWTSQGGRTVLVGVNDPYTDPTF